jgi:hypothetical protein
MCPCRFSVLVCGVQEWLAPGFADPVHIVVWISGTTAVALIVLRRRALQAPGLDADDIDGDPAWHDGAEHPSHSYILRVCCPAHRDVSTASTKADI